MSSVADASGKLGVYMLKGWVLTDQSCRTPGCTVPLMRSPSGRTPVIHFCANCDGGPASVRSMNPVTLNISDTSPSISSSSHISRSSTPPTEVSSALSSPTFAPPVDTEETRRRREQSDTASSEIGKRLLKGWAMLGDECPNVRCYGVPLVRPPKTGGSKNPRKECVICGNVYVTKTDSVGWERLVSVDAGAGDIQVTNSSTAPATSTTSLRDKGQAVVRDETPNASKNVLPFLHPLFSSDTSTATDLASTGPHVPQEADNPTVQPTLTTVAALEMSARALELTLHTLSGRLTSLSSGQAMVDPSSVALTADAINKVAQALSQVKQLQWSESQAVTSYN